MHYWFAVESEANWSADKADGYRFLGLTEARIDAAWDLKEGDLIYEYIRSPLRRLVGIRQVTMDGVGGSDQSWNYDDSRSIGIHTKPIVSLDRSHWISIEEHSDKFTFLESVEALKALDHIRLQEISKKDADFFEQLISEEIAKKPHSRLSSFTHWYQEKCK